MYLFILNFGWLYEVVTLTFATSQNRYWFSDVFIEKHFFTASDPFPFIHKIVLAK